MSVEERIGNLKRTRGVLSTDKLVLYTKLPDLRDGSHLWTITVGDLLKALDERYAKNDGQDKQDRPESVCLVISLD